MGDKTMSKHQEIIFNLFLIHFMMDYWDYKNVPIIEDRYNFAIEHSWNFKTIKDCFPTNEVSTRFFLDGKATNYIAE